MFKYRDFYYYDMSQMTQNPNKTRIATHFFEVSKFFWTKFGEGKNTVWAIATKDLSAAPCMKQPILVNRADGRKTHQKCGALLLKNNKIQVYENLGKWKKPSKETIPHIKVYAGSDDALDCKFSDDTEQNHLYYQQLQDQLEEMIEIEKSNTDYIQEQQETQKQVKKLKVF